MAFNRHKILVKAHDRPCYTLSNAEVPPGRHPSDRLGQSLSKEDKDPFPDKQDWFGVIEASFKNYHHHLKAPYILAPRVRYKFYPFCVSFSQ